MNQFWSPWAAPTTEPWYEPVDRSEWLEDRLHSHFEEALAYRRREKRDRRFGYIGWANDNRRICARHLRMAKHYRETLKGLAG